MRAVWGILLLLLFSGCLNTSMNAAEIAACIHATQTQVVDVPNCTTNEACVEQWNEAVSIPPFNHFPVKKEMIEVQHHIIQAWNALRNAQKLLEKANAACENGNTIQVIQHGLPAAGAIQTALQSTEKSHWTTLAALHTTAEWASKEELERIKDTKMYQYYAEILQILHSLATGNQTDPWGKEWGKNQQYYEEIGNQLTNQPLPSASFDWKDTFAWYDTGIGIAYPEKKKTILWFSTVWKSALSSFTKNKSKNTIVSLMQSIQAEEMMQSIEVSASPNNGLIVHAITLIAGMEKEWHALEVEEIEKIGALEKEIGELNTHQELLEKEMETKKEEWKKLAPFLDTHHQNVEWIEEKWNLVKAIQTEFTIAANDTYEKTKPIGERIERIRKIEKWTNDWKSAIEKQSILNEELDDACIQLGEEMEIEMEASGNEPCAQLTAIIEENAIANEDQLTMEMLLSSCVDAVNEIQQALEEDTTNPAQFIAEFGISAALPGCESMKMALHAHYEQQPHIHELIEIWNAWIEKKDALVHAIATQPEYFSWNEKEEKISLNTNEALPILSAEETSTLIDELEKEMEHLDEALQDGTQAMIDQARWEIQEPLPTTIGESNANARFFIPNPFGKSIKLTGILVIPLPHPSFQPEDEQLLVIDGKIVVEDPLIQKPGMILQGNGTAEWITLQSQPEILSVIGNETKIDVHVFIHSLADTPNAKWEYIFPPGKTSEIKIVHEGKPTDGKVSGTLLEGVIPINQPVEEIKLSFVHEGGVNTTITLLKHETTDNEVNAWYEVKIKNNLELDITTSIQTGIIAPPSGTQAILVLDESSQSTGYSTGIWGDIIIPAVWVPGNSTRTFSILIVTEKEEGKPFIQEVLEDEIAQWIDDENWEIASEAQKLWNKITTNTNPEKWPAITQEVMQLKEKATNLPAEENVEATPNLTPTPTLIQFESKAETILLHAEEWMEKYTRALSITCAKLIETGYHCPLDEKTIKEWKKEWTTDTKKAGLIKKSVASENTAPNQQILNQEEDEKITQKWTTRIENIQAGQNELKKTAEGIGKELEERAARDAREEVQSAWDKFAQAMEKEEYGKAIFIGKNLQYYFASENKWSGFLTIPPIGWPLVGMIVLAGGIYIYNERKKKKMKPVELKPLPTAENEVSPPRAPRGSGGSSPPHTRGEFR